MSVPLPRALMNSECSIASCSDRLSELSTPICRTTARNKSDTLSDMGRAKASEQEQLEYVESGKRLMAVRFAFAADMAHTYYTGTILVTDDDAYRFNEKGRTPASKRVLGKIWAAFPDQFPNFNAFRDYIENGETGKLIGETIDALAAVKDEVIAKRIKNKWPV